MFYPGTLGPEGARKWELSVNEKYIENTATCHSYTYRHLINKMSLENCLVEGCLLAARLVSLNIVDRYYMMYKPTSRAARLLAGIVNYLHLAD